MRRTCALILLLATNGALPFAQEAQTPTAPQASTTGPSMEQTIEFINQAFVKEDPFTIRFGSDTTTYNKQSVQMEFSCSLIVSSTTTTIARGTL